MVLSHRLLVDGGSGAVAGEIIGELLDSVSVPM